MLACNKPKVNRPAYRVDSQVRVGLSQRSGRQHIALGESASPGLAARDQDASPRSGRQHVAQGESASPGLGARERTRARVAGDGV
jgi:hypothetical protein